MAPKPPISPKTISPTGKTADTRIGSASRCGIEQLHSKQEFALDVLNKSAGSNIQDASRQIVAAQLCQLMIDFDSLLLLEQLSEKPELYARMLHGLARLSEAELACSRHRAHVALMKAKLASSSKPAAKDQTIDAATHNLNLL